MDILINNAANNPKMEKTSEVEFSRLENFPLEQWQADLSVGLTGAFLCSQVIGTEMAKRKSGVIVNVASDLAVIAPDQRLYRKPGLQPDQQPVKPVTYSVVKTGSDWSHPLPRHLLGGGGHPGECHLAGRSL